MSLQVLLLPRTLAGLSATRLPWWSPWLQLSLFSATQIFSSPSPGVVSISIYHQCGIAGFVWRCQDWLPPLLKSTAAFRLNFLRLCVEVEHFIFVWWKIRPMSASAVQTNLIPLLQYLTLCFCALAVYDKVNIIHQTPCFHRQLDYYTSFVSFVQWSVKSRKRIGEISEPCRIPVSAASNLLVRLPSIIDMNRPVRKLSVQRSLDSGPRSIFKLCIRAPHPDPGCAARIDNFP